MVGLFFHKIVGKELLVEVKKDVILGLPLKGAILNQAVKTAGFTLVEMMVVVAILSIMAFIGVTSFNTQANRARRSSAKAELSSLYSCEKTYLAEWNQYFEDFLNIGYRPLGTLLYDIGFSDGGGINNTQFYLAPPPSVLALATTPGDPTTAPLTVGQNGPAVAAHTATRTYCPGDGANTCSMDKFAGNVLVDAPTAGFSVGVTNPFTFTAAASRQCPGNAPDLLVIDQGKNIGFVNPCF